jgi:hypothetical protein
MCDWPPPTLLSAALSDSTAITPVSPCKRRCDATRKMPWLDPCWCKNYRIAIEVIPLLRRLLLGMVDWNGNLPTSTMTTFVTLPLLLVLFLQPQHHHHPRRGIRQPVLRHPSPQMCRRRITMHGHGIGNGIFAMDTKRCNRYWNNKWNDCIGRGTGGGPGMGPCRTMVARPCTAWSPY